MNKSGEKRVQSILGDFAPEVDTLGEKREKYLAVILRLVAGAAVIWLCVRFVLPWTAPFILAFALAALMEPAVRAMSRKGIKRSFAAGVLTMGVLGLILWLLFTVVSKGVSTATEFAKKAPELMKAVSDNLMYLEEKILALFSSSSESVEQYMKTAMDAIGRAFFGLPTIISQWLLDFLGKAAQKSPNTLLFAVTAGLGSYFISASFPKTTAFIEAQLPDGIRRKVKALTGELKNSMGGFFRAQLILMAISFFELLLTFLLLGVKNPAGLAAVTALIDALPVFGTGIVLVPWSIYCLLFGDYGRALGLIICWGLVNLVRSCAQAKLLGDEIGLDPISSLASMYLGWKVWKVWGMLLFPLIFSVLRQLNDKGIIKLWKSV